MSESVETLLLHHDRRSSPIGAIHTPIHTSVQYGFPTAEDLVDVFQTLSRRKPIYARTGTPTTISLEGKITLLEGGIETVCMASGMAAISACLFGLLKAGDHLLASRYLFGNTASLLKTLARFGVDVELADPTSAQDFASRFKATTRMVFVESLSNPTTVVPDFEALAAACQAQRIPLVVDNTIPSPLLFRAREIGAALIINSLTKTLAGSGTALGGSVTDTGLFDWTRFDNIAAPFRVGPPAGWAMTQIRKRGLRDIGGALASEHAHAISVGMETARLRVDRTSATALELARFLQDSDKVVRVNYPFLASHPQHDMARRHFRGGSWLLSFSLAAGCAPMHFINRLKVPVKATGLGCARSLVLPVAPTLYCDQSPEERAAAGIDDGLIRYSVGLEDPQDLIADLDAALRSL